jgi:hypothetical protein
MTKHTEKPKPTQKAKADEALSDAAMDQVAGGTACETLSNVSKTRSEISMTFARNARG